MVRRAKVIAAACCSAAAGASGAMVAVPMGRIPRFAPLAPQLRRRHLSPFLQSDAPLESDAAVLREVNARLESRVEELEELLGRTEGLCEVLDDLGGANIVQALR